MRKWIYAQQEELQEEMGRAFAQLNEAKQQQGDIKVALRKKYVLGNLDRIDYEEGRQKVEEKLTEISFGIKEVMYSDTPLAQIFENSASVLEHLEKEWETASDRHKSKIAKALFPAGLTCDKKGGVGTPSNTHVMGLYALLE